MSRKFAPGKKAAKAHAHMWLARHESVITITPTGHRSEYLGLRWTCRLCGHSVTTQPKGHID